MKAKSAFFAFVTFLSLHSVTAHAQNITAQGTVTLNAGTQTSNPIDLRNTGTTAISFTWSTNPTVSAGVCGMQKADVTTGPWTAFGSTFNATASGGPLSTMMVVNYIRFSCAAPNTPIAGTGNVGIRYVGTLSTTSGTGSDVNVTNPSLVVTQSNPAQLNATVTGTVTANAGTGFAALGQGVANTGQAGNLVQCAVTTAAPMYTTGTINPCSIDTTGGLRVSGISGGGGLGQGTMTAGQFGTLIQAAATNMAPAYTTGTTNPLSMDLTGALRVNVVASVGAGGGGTSSNFAAAFPTAGTAAGFTDGTNMQGARVFDVDSGAGFQYVQGVNLRGSGAGGSVELGTATNPLRVDTVATTTVAGTVTANAGTGNFTVIQPGAGNFNATVFQPMGTQLHVNVDSAPTTAVTGTVTANAGTGWFLTQGSTTATQSGSLSMCAVTTGPPAYITAQTQPCSLDLAGNLRVAFSQPIQTTLTNIGGAAVSVNTGATDTGTQRVVLANTQPTLNVQYPTTPNINISQFGGQNVQLASNLPKVAIMGSNGTDAITATSDPCYGGTTIDFNFQPTSAATSIMITNTAGQTTSICGIEVHGNTTTDEIISILSGTGTTCGTGTVLLRGSTTAANGMRIAGGGGGWIAGYANATVLKAGGVAHDICIRQNGANLVTVSGKYIKQ